MDIIVWRRRFKLPLFPLIARGSSAGSGAACRTFPSRTGLALSVLPKLQSLHTNCSQRRPFTQTRQHFWNEIFKISFLPPAPCQHSQHAFHEGDVFPPPSPHFHVPLGMVGLLAGKRRMLRSKSFGCLSLVTQTVLQTLKFVGCCWLPFKPVYVFLQSGEMSCTSAVGAPRGARGIWFEHRGSLRSKTAPNFEIQ